MKSQLVITMKSLEDIKRDMSRLYDDVNAGATDIKTAAELANIAGKYLKAEQLILAREVFSGQLGSKLDGPAKLKAITS